MYNSVERGNEISELIKVVHEGSEMLLEAAARVANAHYRLYVMHEDNGTNKTAKHPLLGLSAQVIDLHTALINGFAAALKGLDLKS